MPSTVGTSVQTKYFYDDEDGTPVEITAVVLNNPQIQVEGVTEETTPFGQRGDQHTPTGRGRSQVIEVSGLFRSGATDDPDDLFGTQDLPLGPEAVTRTFTHEFAPDRSRSIETHLIAYDVTPNRENGLTRFTAKLRTTGDVTEGFPT
jgi:hypothetical protein